MRDRFVPVISLLVASFIASANATAASDVEQRIERIQSGLVPPVVVKGNGVIVMTNSDNGGAYRQDDGTILTFWRDGAQVRVRIWGEPILDLFPTWKRSTSRKRSIFASPFPGLAEARTLGFGELQRISFRSVAPNGSDIFDVKFANGTHEFRILLLPDGRVDRAGFSP